MLRPYFRLRPAWGLPLETLIASDGPDDRFRGLHLAQERNEGCV